MRSSVSPDQPVSHQKLPALNWTQIVGRAGAQLARAVAWAEALMVSRGQSGLICSGDAARMSACWAWYGRLGNWAVVDHEMEEWRGSRGRDTRERNDQGTTRVSGHSRMYAGTSSGGLTGLAASRLQL